MKVFFYLFVVFDSSFKTPPERGSSQEVAEAVDANLVEHDGNISNEKE
jgi:hypothetical protein